MICNRFTFPCVIIDELADLWVEEVMKAFVLKVWTDLVIGTFFDVWSDVTIDVVFNIGVEVLTGVYVNVLDVAMTAL